MNYNPIVYIVDDDPIICQAVVWLLESIHIVAKAYSNAQTFLDNYHAEQQGCLIVDVRMPGMSGLELQQHLNARNNRMPLIMVTGHGDVPMAVRAMQAGAQDFILKPFNDQILLEKIQAAIALDQKGQSTFNKPKVHACYKQLTPRERQVMSLVVTGKLNKQIASELDISMSTVELHRARVMQKMQVQSLADLVRLDLIIQRECV